MTGSVDQPRLAIRPCSLRDANAFVGRERGVAIAGRPKARALDDGAHLEVLRVATDGCPNACSALYGAMARIASAMGYQRHAVLTYTLVTEPGTSLRAAGWVAVATTAGGEWDTPARPRRPGANTEPKIRWQAAA